MVARDTLRWFTTLSTRSAARFQPAGVRAIESKRLLAQCSELKASSYMTELLADIKDVEGSVKAASEEGTEAAHSIRAHKDTWGNLMKFTLHNSQFTLGYVYMYRWLCIHTFIIYSYTCILYVYIVCIYMWSNMFKSN